jgi:hypothetical protein
MVLRASPVRCLRTVAGGYVQLFHGMPLLGNRYVHKAAGKHQPRNEGCAPGGTIFRDPGGCLPRSGEDGIQTDAGIERPPLTIASVLARCASISASWASFTSSSSCEGNVSPNRGSKPVSRAFAPVTRRGCSSISASRAIWSVARPSSDSNGRIAKMSLVDFGFYELRQVSQRLLPAEITGLRRNGIRQALL